MYLLFDACFVVIAIATVIRSAKKGFVRSAVEIIGLALALVISTQIGSWLAGVAYDRTVEPKILSAASSNVGETAQTVVDDLFGAAPQWLTDQTLASKSKPDAVAEFQTRMGEKTETVLADLSQEFVKPTVTRVIGLLITVVLFAVLCILVRLLARFLNRLISVFKITGFFNRLFGGVLGIFKAVLVVSVVIMIFLLLDRALDDSIPSVVRSGLYDSRIFRFYLTYIPFC